MPDRHHHGFSRSFLRAMLLRDRGRSGTVARVLWRTVRSLYAHDGVELAGHLAFTALLALFPFLVFLASLGGLLGGSDSIRALLDFLFRFAPVNVAQTLSTPVVEILSQRPRGFLTLGLLFAIWAASSGVDALRLTLNRAYGFVERRSIWRLKLTSLLAVLVGGGIVFVVGVSIVVGPLLLRWVAPALDDERLFTVGRYGLGILLISAITGILHHSLPAHSPKWHEILPGAVVTSLLIVILAGLFVDHLAHVGSYGAAYGALTGVVLTLLFFYLTALIFIFGAELNTSIHRAALRRHARPPAAGTPPRV